MILQDLTPRIFSRIFFKRLNPCNFDFQYGHPFYSNKIKRFLRIIALGMTPGTQWDGSYQAIGMIY